MDRKQAVFKKHKKKVVSRLIIAKEVKVAKLLKVNRDKFF